MRRTGRKIAVRLVLLALAGCLVWTFIDMRYYWQFYAKMTAPARPAATSAAANVAHVRRAPLVSGAAAKPAATTPTAGAPTSPTGAPTSTLAPRAYNASAKIPRILHQTFSSEMLYENYKPLISRCLSLNPNWTYYLWRDQDSMALIADKYPEFLAQYKKYKDGLERSDSIRYILLHHFGGIYIDMDVECRQPFYPALEAVNSFLDQERIEQTNIYWERPFSVMNSAMGAAPGHPFFRLVINELLGVSSLGSAFSSTGPDILTRVYNKYLKSKPSVPIRLLEPKILSPLMDGGKNWRQMCAGSLASGSKPDSQRSWRDRGCLMLQAKGWRMNDTDAATVCVHRFFHLGYGFAAGERKKPFNATREFWPRVHFYRPG